jgi:hypothetical protein
MTSTNRMPIQFAHRCRFLEQEFRAPASFPSVRFSYNRECSGSNSVSRSVYQSHMRAVSAYREPYYMHRG